MKLCAYAGLTRLLQGAGGVGGLLAMSYHGTATTNAFVSFDGNGNVAALVNTADGSLVAKYEYGPFGEMLRASGPLANVNPIRFSTKYQDDQCDLIYYEYRYYNASSGRWLTRDPIEEQGFSLLSESSLSKALDGPNHYTFVNNDCINFYDFSGLAANWHHMLSQQFEAKFNAAGIPDIDAPEYGVILEAEFHTGESGLHPSWNAEWKKFFDAHPNGIKKKQVLEQLQKMKKDSKFAKILTGGRTTELGYKAWKAESRRLRNLAIKEGLEMSARKGGKKLIKHAPLLGLVFVVTDVNAKGLAGGVLNNIADQVPWLGWGKFGTECVGGDWFPDRPENSSIFWAPSPQFPILPANFSWY